MISPPDTLPAQPEVGPSSDGANGISALELACRRGLPLQQLARSIVLRDRHGFLVALYPADARISLSRIRACSGRHMDFAARSEYQPLLARGSGALPGLIPGTGTVVDSRLLQGEAVYLETADGELLSMPVADFRRSLQGAGVAEISLPLELVARGEMADGPGLPVKRSFEERLLSLALPEPLQSLLQQPVAELEEKQLVRLLARLPDLAAMLIQVAREPLFGGDPQVLTLKQAVARLGAGTAQGWVGGLGISAAFRPATTGLRGHIAYWRDALYTTALLWLGRQYWQELPGTVVMAGLMHNFGYFLLGYLDPERFLRFNRLLAEAPERPVQEMELLVSGDSHCRLGARLSQLWRVPDAVTVTICEHHNPHWQGPHRALAAGVLISGRLLQRFGIGDARHTDIPPQLLVDLAVDACIMQDNMDRLLDHCSVLDALALQMAHLDLIVRR